MPWIRVQGLKKDGNGRIVAGTAAIVDTKYVQGEKHHSKQETREKLGRPLALYEGNRSGIFRSLEEGIVFYDADTDRKEPLDGRSPPRRADRGYQPRRAHGVRRRVPIPELSENMGLTPILRKVFSAEQDFQRCIAHLYHARMRNGGRDRCDHFVAKSFVSQTVRDVLNTGLAVDACFFDIMGDDDVRMLFFQEFVKMRRASDPEFGKCCYVDSTPIPNDIEDNPFNAFSSHDNPAPDVSRGQGRVVCIDPPNAQVKKVYRTFGIKLLNQFPLEKFIAETLP